jgi:2-(1,2-epoxy-1,2-dihydrophenyl)acetyl-CoA isomerase
MLRFLHSWYTQLKELIMQESVVSYEKTEMAALITMNRPKQFNAWTVEFMKEIVASLERAWKDPEVRVVMITGAGKAFCAGGDLGAMESLTNIQDRRYFYESAGRIAKTIQELPKPVLALVNGVAAGAGFNLALCCDIAIAVHEAKFIQSFVKVGLAADTGGFYYLPRMAGLAKAKELMLLARPMEAEEAKLFGLVAEVVESGQLFETGMKYARELASQAPLALELTKKALNESFNVTLEESLESEALANSFLATTEDFLEGARSFREKRPAVFKGK